MMAVFSLNIGMSFGINDISAHNGVHVSIYKYIHTVLVPKWISSLPMFFAYLCVFVRACICACVCLYVCACVSVCGIY